MKLDDTGLKLIQGFESYSPVAYLDEAGVPTIGWGHTAGVKMGDTCSLEQAKAFLEQDLKDAEDCVNWTVKVPLTQNEYDALVSVCFNIGSSEFIKSTLLFKINMGDKIGASKEIGRWVYITDPKTKQKVIDKGLVNRTTVETALFVSDINQTKSVT